MRLFRFSGQCGSAPVARERLQVLLAHERALVGQSDLITRLREEILAVIAKHVSVEPDKVRVRAECGESVSILEVEVDIPAPPAVPLAAAS